MTMQDIQFFTSYQDEIIQTGKPPAPRIQVALAGQRLAIPVSVTTIARTDYVLAGGNPIADQASPHEITFGIVADDEEADLAQLMLDRYSQHPSRQARPAHRPPLRLPAHRQPSGTVQQPRNPLHIGR